MRNVGLKAGYAEMARQLPCKIIMQGIVDEFQEDESNNQSIFDREFIITKTPLTWVRFRESEAKRAKTKEDDSSKELNAYATSIQNNVRTIVTPYITKLPIIGYYGTGRLWGKKHSKTNNYKQGDDFYMRLFAYKDCLTPDSSYKDFADWFTLIFECYREQQINEKERGRQEWASPWKNNIQVVQEAVNNLLEETGWHSLEYSVSYGKTLILKHEQYGTLTVESLSDGIRSVLGVVGDIAYRCTKLNPHFGLNAAKETSGVIMIDEIELHLHPAWQQTVLVNLCKAFPKIQFIVTTHSPQIISTVPSHQIRILDKNQVYSAESGTQGAESSRILKEVFGVELRAQHLEIVTQLNRYLELIDEDKWDTEEALALRQTLDEWGKGNEPELIKADIDIRMKEFQRQL